MNGFRERFTRFMSGRYGYDELSKTYLWVANFCFILYIFTHSSLIFWAGLLLLSYEIYRCFSKNIAKMSAQNQNYLNWRYKRAVKLNQSKNHWAQRKDYRFYHCPSCSQKVRVPRGRGKIAITCPKCKTEFIKKS